MRSSRRQRADDPIRRARPAPIGRLALAQTNPLREGLQRRDGRSAIDNGSSLIPSFNHLIVTDFDAIEAYEAAIDRLSNQEDARMLESFRDDHRRHVERLSALVREAGYEPIQHADLHRFVTKGKVMIGGLMGDDAILRAMLSNESETNEAYDAAGLPREIAPEARLLLAHCLDDERRHREWLERRITLTPKGEPVFPPLAG